MKRTHLLTILLLLTHLTVNAQSLKGTHWTAWKTGDHYILSVADQSSILDALTDFVNLQQISAGEITGIAALNEATLRFFDPATKKYVDKTFSEQLEMSNLSGNISISEGKPLLHLHATLGRRDYTALAGHLQDGKIRGAGEFFVYPLNTRAVKIKNEAVGLNFYDLDQQ